MLSELEVKYTFSEIDALYYKYSSSEIKYSVLRLLLFKRLSDLSRKEEQVFFVPEKAHWSLIKQEQHNLAEKLDDVLKLIETANPHLEGVLTDVNVNFWDRFDDKTLSCVITLLSELDLSSRDPNDLKQLSEVVARFTEKYASKEIKVQKVYTPRQITTMIVKLLNPQQEASIYDPACGSGEFLTEAVRFIRQNGKDASKAKICGQSESSQECVITKTNLILHGIDKPDIRQGNVIFEPRFIQGDEMKLFDIVLLNPPFNLKYSKCELDRFRESNEFIYGVPKSGIGDFLFVQRAIRSLKETGKAAIILPRGCLFREGDEENIRERMIKDDLIEAVVELAPGLFYGTSIPVTIIVFARKKIHEKKVLFIDASREYKAGRGLNILQTEHIDHIVSTYHKIKEEKEFSRLVSIEEIADNKYNLSVNRYINLTKPEQIEVANEIKRLHELESKRSEIEEKIDNYLKALGIKI